MTSSRVGEAMTPCAETTGGTRSWVDRATMCCAAAAAMTGPATASPSPGSMWTWSGLPREGERTNWGQSSLFSDLRLTTASPSRSGSESSAEAKLVPDPSGTSHRKEDGHDATWQSKRGCRTHTRPPRGGRATPWSGNRATAGSSCGVPGPQELTAGAAPRGDRLLGAPQIPRRRLDGRIEPDLTVL